MGGEVEKIEELINERPDQKIINTMPEVDWQKFFNNIEIPGYDDTCKTNVECPNSLDPEIFFKTYKERRHSSISFYLDMASSMPGKHRFSQSLVD